MDTYFLTGATHLDFVTKNNAGKIATYGNLTAGSSGNGYHGAHVMGLAAGDYNSNSSSHNTYYSGGNFDKLKYGTMGVAYNAGLHLSDFNKTESGSTRKYRASATDSAKTAEAIAQNNSWGFSNAAYTINYFKNLQDNNGYSDLATYASITDTEANWSSYVTALNNFQTTGVIVFASGNNYSADSVGAYSGMPIIFSELAEAWLTVGNVDVTGSTLSSSTVSRKGNPCGIAAEFCINADGHNVTAAYGSSNTDNNRYGVLTGTSMAAPIVSGSIALLSEAFPNHTPEQLVDRLLASANNDFFTATGTTSFINGITHGYNTEYGHGMLDLATALGPISTSSMIPPSNGEGLLNTRYGNIDTARRFDISSSQIQLSSAFGDSVSNALNGKKAYFYDALNGGFAFNIGSLASGTTSNETVTHSFAHKMQNSTIQSRQTSEGINFISDSNNSNSLLSSLMTFMPISDNNSAFLGKNINIQNAMSFTQRNDDNITGINSNSPFSIPFIDASEKGSSYGNLSKFEKGTLSYGVFDGKSKEYNLATEGFFIEYGQDFSNSHASLFIGTTKENDGFLKTSVSGAFSEKSLADTNFIGTSAYGWLNNNWSYNAMATMGKTELDINGLGLLSDIENITSTSFAIEIARPINLNKNDNFHIGISQPLRIESGNASIAIPQLYDINGNLNYDEVSFELAPSGRQIDFNIGYSAKLEDNLNLGLLMALSKDYGHIQSQNLTYSTIGFLKFDF